jgi:hypothetical protein
MKMTNRTIIQIGDREIPAGTLLLVEETTSLKKCWCHTALAGQVTATGYQRRCSRCYRLNHSFLLRFCTISANRNAHGC